MIQLQAALADPYYDELEDFMPSDPLNRGYHEPVLLSEVLELLQPATGKVFVDGTLGGGGHSSALLAAGAKVIGIDQDREARNFATPRLAEFGDRFQAVAASYHEVAGVLKNLGIEKIDGALLDLGVSSHQLDTAERGFSFQHDGPLDMRMNPDGSVTTAILINTASEEQLAQIFREYGEEPAARRVAARIVRERTVTPFTHTLQLADFVASVVPRKGRAHPATRIFQALRIAVNRELEVLKSGLEAFTGCLAPGARFGVISFHSLEDRIVKNFFRDKATEWIDRPEWPAAKRNPDHQFKLITSHPVIASETEQKANSRSRSAKFRVVERLPYVRR